MAKVNWYIAAQKSDNEEVKALLKDYKGQKEKEEKIELRDKIIILLTPQNGEETVSANKKPEKSNVSKEETGLSEKSIKAKKEKMKDLRADIYKIERSELKHPTQEEKKEHRAKIKVKSKEILALRKELRSDREHKKAEVLRKNGHISSIKLKQKKILTSLENGISFTNITKRSDGVNIDEIAKVVESDGDFLNKIKRIDKRLPAIWYKWKKKFIKD